MNDGSGDDGVGDDGSGDDGVGDDGVDDDGSGDDGAIDDRIIKMKQMMVAYCFIHQKDVFLMNHQHKMDKNSSNDNHLKI